jgi:hypothetical protein
MYDGGVYFFSLRFFQPKQTLTNNYLKNCPVKMREKNQTRTRKLAASSVQESLQRIEDSSY